MTKKDYIVIATALKNALPFLGQCDKHVSDMRENIINEFGFQLQKENSRFDIVKFKKFINS